MISVPEFLLTFHDRTPGTPRENVFLNIQGKSNPILPKWSAKTTPHEATRQAWHQDLLRYSQVLGCSGFWEYIWELECSHRVMWMLGYNQAGCSHTLEYGNCGNLNTQGTLGKVMLL